MYSALKRLIGNIANYGTITQTKSADGKSLARVKIGERETDFLPGLSLVNSFFKVYSPMRVGEQVVVISPFGEASSGFILRSIFNVLAKEPTWASDTTSGVEFEDGTTITYDTKAKELKVNASDKITIICKAATITADTVDITATTSNTGDVTINGNLTVSGNIDGGGNFSVAGGISDSKGDLTGHTHSTTDGATATAR